MEMVQIVAWILDKIGVMDYLPPMPAVKTSMPWEGLTEEYEVCRYLFYAIVGAMWIPVLTVAVSLFTF